MSKKRYVTIARVNGHTTYSKPPKDYYEPTWIDKMRQDSRYTNRAFAIAGACISLTGIAFMAFKIIRKYRNQEN